MPDRRGGGAAGPAEAFLGGDDGVPVGRRLSRLAAGVPVRVVRERLSLVPVMSLRPLAKGTRA